MEKPNYSSVEKQSSTMTLDSIKKDSDFSYYPLLILLNSLMAFFTVGIEMNLYNFLLIPFKNKFNYGNVFEEFCVSMIFYGFAVGAFVIGYMSKSLGRILLIQISSIGIFAIHLIMFIFLNEILYFIFRFLMGVLLGAYVVLIINILSEYKSESNRNLYLCFLWISYQLGCLTESLFGWAVMPNYEKKRIRGLLSIYLFFPVCSALLNFFTINDSPTNFILNGERDKAYVILKSMNKDNDISDDDKLKIENEINNSNLSNINLTVFDSLQNNASSNTILLYLSLLILAGSYYGILVLTSLTKNHLYKKYDNVYNRVVKSQVLIYLISLIITTGASFIIHLKLLSKKLFLMICFILAAFVTFFAIYIKATYSWLIGIYLGATFVSANLLIRYLNDFFNSNNKDLSLGFQLMCYSALCAFSVIWMLALSHVYFRFPYYLYCAFCTVGAILIYLSPFDDIEGKYNVANLNPERSNLNENQHLYKDQ